MYRLYWRPKDDGPMEWRTFEDIARLKAFVSAMFGDARPKDGELRLEAVMEKGWSITLTAADVARWSPPAKPNSLLASRWSVDDASSDAAAAVEAEIRSTVGRGVAMGLLTPQRGAAINRAVDEAFAKLEDGTADEGPRGVGERVSRIARGRIR